MPQEVVRRILDHDSHMMTARYARLSDTTIRRHWEAARKVNIKGQQVTLDPAGPLAEAAWAKQRVGRATQALPNGYCGLPVVKTCPHANACLTCPMFVTTPQFLPQHHEHRRQVIQIISAAQARGQQRLAEMNQQVLGSLDRIITTLEGDHAARMPAMQADNTTHLITAASRRHELTRSKAIRALRSLDATGAAVTFEIVARQPGFPGPGSTPSPTSGPRSNSSAASAAEPPQRRCRAASAAAMPPCCAASRPPTRATGNSPKTTSGCAASSPEALGQLRVTGLHGLALDGPVRGAQPTGSRRRPASKGSRRRSMTARWIRPRRGR